MPKRGRKPSSSSARRSEPRAYRQEWLVLEHLQGSFKTIPLTNPFFSTRSHLHSVGNGARIVFGRVVDAVAGMHAYRVFLEPGMPPFICTLLSRSALLPIGAREIQTIPPGAGVWVLLHEQLSYGVILGVEPDADIGPPRMLLPGSIYLGSRSGVEIDRMHQVIDSFPDGATPAWIAGRPLDGTTAGEWGAITESGLKITLDSAMAQIAASEATGVFVFLWDQALRLAGYNWQSFSCGHEEEIFQDEGEIYHYRGHAVYPWEQLGVSDASMEAFIEQRRSEGRASIEPQSDDQQAIHRILHFGGYLGQGGKRLVALPEKSKRNTYDSPAKATGVFEENIALTGRYSLRSAHSILICRRPAIPVPRRRRRLENPEGDTSDNYKPSGLYGSGPEHKIVDGPKPSYNDDPAGQSAAAVDDLLAYAYNWENLHQFHYHENDWELDEEEDLELKQKNPSAPGAFEQKSAAVDHRYGEALYTLNTSYICFLPEGGVLLGDGFGAEIKLVGGSIYLTAPKDVVIQTGENFTVMAGRDCNLKGHDSCEVVANAGDLRLKAENNLHALAGNSGGGGILLESRSPSSYSYDVDEDTSAFSGGIQLKAPNGSLDVWANSMYFRTWSESGSAGPIILDADKGNQTILTNSSSFLRYANVYQDSIGKRGNVKDTLLFAEGSAVISTPLILEGHLTAKGGAIFKGFVNILEGHIGTEKSERYGGLVGVLKGESLQITRDAFNQNIAIIADTLKSGRETYSSFLDKQYYQDDKPGSDALISKVGFTFKSSKLYGTSKDDFKLWETRWQRLMGGSLWNERPVRTPGAQSGGDSTLTYAYPGREAWLEGKYLEQPEKFSQDGVAVQRGSAYEDAELAEPNETTPAKGYKRL